MSVVNGTLSLPDAVVWQSLPGLTKVHLRLGCGFGYGFLQISHWQMVRAVVSRFVEPPLCLPTASLSTLALTYSLPTLKSEIGISPIS